MHVIGSNIFCVITAGNNFFRMICQACIGAVHFGSVSSNRLKAKTRYSERSCERKCFVNIRPLVVPYVIFGSDDKNTTCHGKLIEIKTNGQRIVFSAHRCF